MSKERLKNLIKLIVVCALAAVVAVLAIVYFVQDNAYAWFAKNNQVSANGMQTTVKGDYNVELTPEEFTDIMTLYPGQEATITLTFKNNESQGLKADIYLTVGEETGIEDAGKYYYFGSQIKVTAVETTANYKGVTSNFFLLETEAKNSGQKSYVTQEYTAVNKQIISRLELLANSIVTVTLTFEFVDNGDDQNMYKNFGKSSGRCSRGILAVLSQ